MYIFVKMYQTSQTITIRMTLLIVIRTLFLELYHKIPLVV